LTEELVREGHDVTLYASGDSTTSARLVATTQRSLRSDPGCTDPIAHHIVMLERVLRDAPEFDVIHFHCDYLHFPLSRRQALPALTTLHGRLDIPDLVPLYRTFPDVPLVSISDAQRTPLPWVRWIRTVHHGLPDYLYTFRNEPGGYLAFVGRLSPEKRVDRAVEIAGRVGMKLRIAAKLDGADRTYFDQVVRPLLRKKHVEYIGEIDEREKDAFIGGALALLFPIDWPEPFGLVMIEAMACGTPVVAYRGGSVDEVMEASESGYVVETIAEAAEAVVKAASLERARCRRVFDRRFTAARMAADYVALYEHVAASGAKPLQVA
jgi:glycosyltransferase involved in cell wall biosynthesis